MRAASVILLLLAASWGIVAQAAVGISSGSCKPRETVSEAIRQPYEKAALDFVSEIVHGDFPQAQSQMREELRNALTGQAFADSLKPDAEAFKSLGSLSVSRSYLLDVRVTAGNGQQFAMCQADMKIPMSSPQGRITLVTDQTPTEAYVLVEGKVPQGTWVFTLWMVRPQNIWLISHFHAAPPLELDKTPDELFILATEQAERGHSFNAYLFYSGVMATAYRGQKFSLGIRSESEAKMKQLKLPPEFAGRTPYSMQMGQSTYRVSSVKLAADNRRLALEITYQAGVPQNDALIRDLKMTHPDYLEGFDSLIAISIDPSGKRSRSVERLH